MTQSRYFSAHYDSPPDERQASIPRGPRNTVPGQARPESDAASYFRRRDGLPDFVQSGPQAGERGCLRFLAPRKLRRLDIEGPSCLMLSINGRPIGHVQPGENVFDPPVTLHEGDTLQLEAVEHDEALYAALLTGPATSSAAAADQDVSAAREGRHD